MAGGASTQDAAAGSPAPKKKGRATIDTLIIGCIAMVDKNGEAREAEILSIKETKSGRQYYCNFINFNKRLDDWVPASKIDFSQEVTWPNPEKVKEKKAAAAPAAKKTVVAQKKGQKRVAQTQTREVSVASESSTQQLWEDSQKPTPDPESRETVPVNFGDTPGFENDDPMELDEPAKESIQTQPVGRQETQEEIKRLRVGGSMTQNQGEIHRIRNISKVQFGRFELNPWYFSPYPEEFTKEDVMYICEFCLDYFGDTKSFTRHRQKCTLQHPPGNEIYRDDYVSFFEIDGRRQRRWCRSLCLLSKMFLDHKTLYYDVDPFLFYVMATRDEKGFHMVGYFSKEKECAEGYNVACILTMPQYQRKGYGRLLIQFSYELSKIEGKAGSPEKPLSDLGLLSYRQYWIEQLIEILLICNDSGDKINIEQLAQDLAMTVVDVETTLQAYKMQVYHKGEHKIIITKKELERREDRLRKQAGRPKQTIDPEKIQWKPPVFTASTRTWGW